MSILNSILSKVVGVAKAAESAEHAMPGTAASQTAAPSMTTPTETAPATPTPTSTSATAPVDVEAVLSNLAAESGQRLNWRTSIVDLMKLLNLDSSLSAREQLARELGYTGRLDGSAAMNMWLHKAVMRKLAENGGKVPSDLVV